MSDLKNNFHDLFRDPSNQGKIISIYECVKIYNVIHSDNKISIEYLYDQILSNKLDSELRILFSKYDRYENQDLQDFLPETEKRRKKVYDLLNIPSHISEKINEIVPMWASNDYHRTLEGLRGEKEWDPWVHKVDTDNYWWNKFKESLEKSLPEDVKEEVIMNLDISSNTILNDLHPPQSEDAYRNKGLVIGHIQSGKTSNMQALTAKAIDVGYKLVIVLSGTNKILRAQTQRRFDKQNFGKEIVAPHIFFDQNFTPSFEEEYQLDDDYEDFTTHGNSLSDGRVTVHRVTTSKGNGFISRKELSSIKFKKNFPGRMNTIENLNTNDAYFAAIMKNPANLKKMKKEIELTGLRNELANIPILIIDDESDSASPNVGRKRLNEISKTNEAIRELLNQFPRAQYVAYTATPAANIFIDQNNPEDIYPKDFMWSLKTSPGYMGSKDFEDTKYIRSVYLDGGHQNLEKLQEAVDSFVLSGAIKLYRVSEQGVSESLTRHHTMLVHESSSNETHDDTKRLITREIWDKADYLGGKGLKRLETLFKDDFIPHSKTFGDDEPISKKMIDNFESLKPYIQEAIKKIELGGKIYQIVNQTEPSPDFSKENIWRIFIGGNMLSRGYTVEGLTISYYSRNTQAGDTLQQMARWYGYRNNYKDLVRLFIARNAGPKNNVDLYEEFMGESMRDRELRRRITIAKNHDSNPYQRQLTTSDYGALIVAVYSDYGSKKQVKKPTRISAMQNMELAFDNFGSQNQTKELFPLRKEKDLINSNYNLVFSYLKDKQIQEVNFAADKSSKSRYLINFSSPERFLNEFLNEFKMQQDKADSWRYVKKFLESKKHDFNINKWLMMIVGGDGSELKKFHKEEMYTIDFYGKNIKAVKRSRNSNNGGFAPSGSPDTNYAEFLSHGYPISPDKSSDLTKVAEEAGDSTAVALIYFCNFEEFEKTHSVGLSLHFPNNNEDSRPVYFQKETDQEYIPNPIS